MTLRKLPREFCNFVHLSKLINFNGIAILKTNFNKFKCLSMFRVVECSPKSKVVKVLLTNKAGTLGKRYWGLKLLDRKRSITRPKACVNIENA